MIFRKIENNNVIDINNFEDIHTDRDVLNTYRKIWN